MENFPEALYAEYGIPALHLGKLISSYWRSFRLTINGISIFGQWSRSAYATTPRCRSKRIDLERFNVKPCLDNLFAPGYNVTVFSRPPPDTPCRDEYRTKIYSEDEIMFPHFCAVLRFHAWEHPAIRFFITRLSPMVGTFKWPCAYLFQNRRSISVDRSCYLHWSWVKTTPGMRIIPHFLSIIVYVFIKRSTCFSLSSFSWPCISKYGFWCCVEVSTWKSKNYNQVSLQVHPCICSSS